MNTEEKKVSIDNIEDLLEKSQNESAFSLQAIFAMLVLNWHWFLLSLFIFGCGALLYLRYADPVYNVTARMLIKDDNVRNNSSQMLDKMEELNMTQKQLAELMGCSQQYVSKVLKGQENLSLETLSKIEDCLEISILQEELELA